MRLMAIDHGLRRIGLAVSDASGLVARELTVLRRKSNAEDFARIHQLAQQQQAEAFVVGLPSNADYPGQSSQAETVRRWVARFAETTALPIVLWDEQLSSVDARELARQQRRKPGQPIDDLAARVILQSYLNAVHDGLAEFPSGNP